MNHAQLRESLIPVCGHDWSSQLDCEVRNRKGAESGLGHDHNVVTMIESSVVNAKRAKILMIMKVLMVMMLMMVMMSIPGRVICS